MAITVTPLELVRIGLAGATIDDFVKVVFQEGSPLYLRSSGGPQPRLVLDRQFMPPEAKRLYERASEDLPRERQIRYNREVAQKAFAARINESQNWSEWLTSLLRETLVVEAHEPSPLNVGSRVIVRLSGTLLVRFGDRKLEVQYGPRRWVVPAHVINIEPITRAEAAREWKQQCEE